jgi:hypothetical protein
LDRPARDKLLVEAALRELASLSLATLEAEGKAICPEDPITGQTVSRWKRGERGLNKNSRPKVESFLKTRGLDLANLVISRETAQGGDVATASAASANVFAHWVREVEQMQAEPGLVGIQRTLRIESLNASLRSYALAKVAEATDRAEQRALELVKAARGQEPSPEPTGPHGGGEPVIHLGDEAERKQASAAAGKRRAGRGAEGAK